jgi:hypothetical protein
VPVALNVLFTSLEKKIPPSAGISPASVVIKLPSLVKRRKALQIKDRETS